MNKKFNMIKYFHKKIPTSVFSLENNYIYVFQNSFCSKPIEI